LHLQKVVAAAVAAARRDESEMKRQEILFGLKSFSFIYDRFLLFPANMGEKKFVSDLMHGGRRCAQAAGMLIDQIF
jgi:hypothetical protein